jgi:hypothetical protein
VFGLYKNIMLTRLEVLSELQRIGIKEPALLKKYLEDIEHYMRTNHALKITTRKTESEEEIFREKIFKKISPLFK